MSAVLDPAAVSRTDIRVDANAQVRAGFQERLRRTQMVKGTGAVKRLAARIDDVWNSPFEQQQPHYCLAPGTANLETVFGTRVEGSKKNWSELRGAQCNAECCVVLVAGFHIHSLHSPPS